MKRNSSSYRRYALYDHSEKKILRFAMLLPAKKKILNEALSNSHSYLVWHTPAMAYSLINSSILEMSRNNQVNS